VLERAARMRPDPGTNVITYGTNRLERYHPYLRLAEAYLMAGQPDKAQDALKRSAARGKEPADERARLAAQVETALERTRMAAAAPPPTLAAAAPPVTAAAAPTAPPTTIAAAPAPPATTAVAGVRGAPSPAAPRAAASGRLDLRSEPAGATVLLGDRLLGTTPLQVELAPGDYTVTLRKEGTADTSFPVRIGPAKTTVETRALVATAPAAVPSAAPPEIASLVVYSQPPGARVYLDDEPLGATDPRSGRLVKSGVAPGTHRVRLAGDGLADAAEDVAVPEHGPATVRIQLTPSTTFRSSGLTWTLVAAAWTALLVAGAWAWRRRRAAAAMAGASGATVGLPATPLRSATVSRTPAGARATLDGRGATAAGPATSTKSGSRETTALPTPARGSADPERFGEFRLLEPLGKGGMAAVFKAERRGEVCALKRPLAAFLEDPEFLERFLREAEIGRTLHHPNIIRIYERGDVDGLPYFTMELVKGETLAARVRAGGALDARRATDVIAQVAEALDYAHLKGVVHRDLKPSNIMILEDGAVKVMDYGIARARRFEGLTVTGAFLGTPDYVAPETAEGKGTDARSDLYSLGIVFYEILTGKRPFVGDTPFATLRKHVSEPPTPPSVVAPGIPRELEAIILKLLAKSPEDRYPGAEELLIVLREFLNRAA